MAQNNQQAFHTPVVGKVAALNKYIYERRTLVRKDIRINYVIPLMNRCRILYCYSVAEVKGKSYMKRIIPLMEEIEGDIYLISVIANSANTKGGWNMKLVSTIDSMCVEIMHDLHAEDATHIVPES